MRLKGLMILADGFEDTEALATYDVLSRSGIDMVTATPNDNLLVLTQYNHKIYANIHISQINVNDYDFLVIPGGKAVMKVLEPLLEIDNIINDFILHNKLIASICAAPYLLGNKGYFINSDYTCFPGFDINIPSGNYKTDGVIVGDKFITAKAMYYSIEFALAIIEKLQGYEQKQKVLASLKGEK